MQMAWVITYLGAAALAASAVRLICRIGGDR